MSNSIQDKCEEINLMLVMTSADDKPSLQIIIELFSDIQKLPEADEKIKSACKWLQGKKEDPGLFGILESMVQAFSKYITDGGDISFPNEQTSSANNDLNDTNGNVETSFLGEYIENHTMMLEDFESWIVEYRNSPSDASEFTKQIKRYLHNLKGDSGTIGLTGIEKVCHYLEDYLQENSADALMAELIKFKEWVVSCMKDYAEGKEVQVKSARFIEELGLPDSSIVEESDAPVTRVNNVQPEPEASKQVSAISTYNISGERDIMFEFAAEAEEHLGNVETVILENEGAFGKEEIDCIFRGVHSIKGGSAYFTLEEMTACSHILENYLSEVRDGKRQLDETLKAHLLTYIDLQKNVLKRAREAAMSNGVMTKTPESIQFLNVLEAYGSGAQIAAPAKQAAAMPAQMASPVEAVEPQKAKEGQDKSSDKIDVKNFVKVDTARLDLLIDSIGEMVIYSSMLIRQCRELLGNNQNVMNASHRVEKFSRDLQDIGMSMRLVPIKGLFQKMSRLVWDTSRKLGKDIAFQMEGEDTELDRNLIDKLTDPLMHMVRNALDHGVEPSDERQSKGKPAQGNIKLSAYHSGGTINICIEDDGRGLDPEKLIKKAIEKGILEEGSRIPDSEAYHLIFAAGFSTAAAVTDISGRGVGMDVVRRNVESLRGRINIESSVNKGSKFTIELPLTLAIVDGIQVRVGKENFIIPSFSIIEFVRATRDILSDTLDSAETFYFRGKYLPVFRLSDLYSIPNAVQNPCSAAMVVVENGNEHVALMVDEILGDYSTVIKSLGPMFTDSRGMAGCAIMPDGEVALILDVRSLVELARKEYKPLTKIQNIEEESRGLLN